jgi:hypothetical protein
MKLPRVKVIGKILIFLSALVAIYSLRMLVNTDTTNSFDLRNIQGVEIITKDTTGVTTTTKQGLVRFI